MGDEETGTETVFVSFFFFLFLLFSLINAFVSFSFFLSPFSFFSVWREMHAGKRDASVLALYI